MSRPIVSIIVARGADGSIGRNGDLAFHIREDLRNFKLPGGARPGRRNIVISRNPAYSPAGAEKAGSIEEALALCGVAEEVMIIGGATIYSATLPIADKLYITEIDATLPDADTFFPTVGPEWVISESSEPATDPASGLTYRFTLLQKKLIE